MGMITWIRAPMPESRETVFRPASGGGLRTVIDASKLDLFVQLAITNWSYKALRQPTIARSLHLGNAHSSALLDSAQEPISDSHTTSSMSVRSSRSLCLALGCPCDTPGALNRAPLITQQR